MPCTCTHPSQPFLPCYFRLAFLLSSFLFLFSSCLYSAVTCVLTQVTFHLTPNLHLLRGLQRSISVMRRKGRREGTMCICVTPPPLHLLRNLRAPVPVPGNILESSPAPCPRPLPRTAVPQELHLGSYDGVWRIDQIWAFL